MSAPTAILVAYAALERRLVDAGFPATSPWWWATLTAFYSLNRAQRRQLVARVGRRGGKSSTLCRIAVCEALYGDHVVQPGDVGVVAIISVNRDEAAARLRTIAAILDALGVRYRRVGDTIELADRPIIFKVFTASISGVQGFTCICAICDEVAHWRDADTNTNPATEVLASLRPTMATMPNARIYLISSPLSTLDAHYHAFETGDSDFQMCVYAATWTANPTISEDDTRRLEPNERLRLRAYAAIPSAAVSAAFEMSAIMRTFAPRSTNGYIEAERVIVIDASSGMNDAYTWATLGWYVQADVMRNRFGVAMEPVPPPKPPFLALRDVEGVEGAFWSEVKSDDIVNRIAEVARAAGVHRIFGDQREAFALEAAFRRAGLTFTSIPWTQPSKVEAVERLRRWLADGMLALPPHDKLKSELLSFEERFTASGAQTYGARRGGHDDYAALCVTGAMVDLAGALPRSPLRRQAPRGTGRNSIGIR